MLHPPCAQHSTLDITSRIRVTNWLAYVPRTASMWTIYYGVPGATCLDRRTASETSGVQHSYDFLRPSKWLCSCENRWPSIATRLRSRCEPALFTPAIVCMSPLACV
eukprot:scaffold281136_cov33-Tisochrysis_lutea.AAC.3